MTGDQTLLALSALASPHRLRIIALLAGGPIHVSQLARDLGLSRPLTHMHLQRLEAAGLVSSRLELSEKGQAMRSFEVTPFALHLTPGTVSDAVRTLTDKEDQ